MTQKNITVPKTARYFVLGEPSDKIEHIWFVCHGYGELAKYHVKYYEALVNDKTLVVAPEALNRFYRQGFSGKVGASWITKEERESEIADSINYLNMVYSEVLAPFKNKNVTINILGFSQGSAMVCRWVTNHKTDVKNLILWSGSMAHDINFEKEKDFFNSINLKFVMGLEDEFYNAEEIEKLKEFISSKGISFEYYPFKGKHEVNKEALLEVAKQL